MVVIHDVLVPFRFLALLGHFLAALLALYAAVRAALFFSLSCGG